MGEGAARLPSTQSWDSTERFCDEFSVSDESDGNNMGRLRRPSYKKHESKPTLCRDHNFLFFCELFSNKTSGQLVEWAVNLTSMSLDCGRNPSRDRTHDLLAVGGQS